MSLRAFLNHPAGPKTIFFWAPTMKWGLVIAGLGDYARPAEKLSVSQSAVLAVTGSIWSRYSLVIIPKNWNLFTVNLFLAFTGYWQLLRIYNVRRHPKSSGPEDKVQTVASTAFQPVKYEESVKSVKK